MTRVRLTTSAPSDIVLPVGVVLRELPARSATTGDTIDLFGGDWNTGVEPVQWNFVTSRPDTMRGVHVHPKHSDYLCVLRGGMLVGLHDMRPWSATYRLAVLHTLHADAPSAIVIPPGVAHGFYTAGATEHIYAVDRYWDPADELGCFWNDPALDLPWPTSNPAISRRDREAQSYAALAQRLNEVMNGDQSRS